MEATRRYWSVVGVGFVLAAGAVVFDRPVLLVGAAGIGSWLLSEQYRFVREVARLDGVLVVDQSSDTDRVPVDTPLAVTLSGELTASLPLDVTVTADPSVGLRASSDRTVEVAGRERATTFTVESPTAGRFDLPSPTVTATDERGLFRTSFPHGPARTITVTSQVPDSIHVGEGGDQVAVAYGRGAGTIGVGGGGTLAGIREYVPGDSLRQIDWKATARQGSPHVRETEIPTVRTTTLYVDHRAAMDQGPPATTKLDLVRELAIALLDDARSHDDPVALHTVGGGGTTGRYPAKATPDHYSRLRQELVRVEPTESELTGERRGRSPTGARLVAGRLDGDSGFDRQLRPFFTDEDPFVERIGDRPLFRTAQGAPEGGSGSAWQVVLTDDTDREEVRETVNVGRSGGDHVTVFLTPSVFFEEGGLADITRAYERYREFEEFRRSLSDLDRVRAFEVAPGDRIDAVLSGSHRRGETTGVNAG